MTITPHTETRMPAQVIDSIETIPHKAYLWDVQGNHLWLSKTVAQAFKDKGLNVSLITKRVNGCVVESIPI